MDELEMTEDAASASEKAPKWRPVIICASAFTTVFTCCGILFSFGVFQDLYQQMSLQPDTPFTGATVAVIDLIGTFNASFLTIFSPFMTSWAKMFSPRAVTMCGGIVFLLGCMLASISTQTWQFVLTQGVLLGLGSCASFIPAVTCTPTWFSKHRGLALGVILAGTGVGGLTWTPMITQLVSAYGFRAALRISGGLAGSLIIVSSIPLAWDPATETRLRAPGGRPRSLFDIPLINWRTFKSRTFALQWVAGMLQGAAYYTPIFFFGSYGRTLGYSTSQSANFIAITNACNAIGKVIMGLVADRFGLSVTFFAASALAAASTLSLWIPSCVLLSQSAARGLFIAYAVGYGIFASAYISLFPAVLLESVGPGLFPGAYSFLYMSRGLAALAGTPTAGALVRSGYANGMPSDYLSMAAMTASLLTGATAILAWQTFSRQSRKVSDER